MGKRVSVRRLVGVIGPAVVLAFVGLLVQGLGGCGDDTGGTPDAAPCVPVDDDNECTDDVCRDGAPVHDPVTPGTDCANGSCSAAGTCEAPTCTDGFHNGDETGVDCGRACPGHLCPAGMGCDGAADCDSNVCIDDTCRAARCGDGVMQAGEMCDDGNDNNGDGCDDGAGDACRPTGCGNGVVSAPETCDDGNNNNGDGCDNNCTPTGCGNGVTTGAETCDDGNTMASDGCSAACATEPGYTCTMAVPSVCTTRCGDGIRAGTEACDDSNMASNDGCSGACVVEFGFSCMGAPSMCRSTCGDGLVASNEGCDDAPPAENGDGCSATCTVEAGFTCMGTMPSTCVRRCGNGVVDSGEQCDDANMVAGDGCAACMLEITCGAGEIARVVTSSTDLAIPDADPAGVSSPVAVVGAGAVTRAAVFVGDLTHPYDGDLELSLVSPGGLGRALVTHRGAEGDNFRQTHLVDTANVAIASGVAPFTGRFRPEQSLSTTAGSDFLGVGGAGTWNLHVADTGGQDEGVLHSWSLLLCLNPTATFCGDGVRNGAEECDDGNSNNADACSNACTVTSGCGDGDLDVGEICDDDNVVSGDGCSATCTIDITCGAGETPIILSSAPAAAIPDNDPAGVTASVNVALTGAVTRLIVSTRITHTADGDLDLTLTGPNGVARELSTDNGALGDNYAGTQFDDASVFDIVAATAPFTGRYRPEQSLASLPGVDFRASRAAGAWTLRAVDDSATETGTLQRLDVALCVAPAGAFCGNGVREGNEDCDDGNLVNTDACSNLCQIADGCGDGNLDPGETCDDDNVLAGDGCSPACMPDITCGPGETAVIVNSAAAMPIPDNVAGLLSSVQVNTAGLVRRVIPILNVTHPVDLDLEMYLLSPRGVQRSLAFGRSGVDFRATLFSDGALRPIASGVAPYTGAFRPEQTIADAAGFAGQQAQGAWSVRIGDRFMGSAGTLESWNLAVCVDAAAGATRCGNGVVEAGEHCDDTNLANGDGCSATCQLELGCGAGQTATVISAADLPRLVPDNLPAGVTSTLNVAGATPIAKVVVVLGTLTHTYDGDVDISLTSPMGTSVDLSSGNGAGENDYVSTIFADGATAPIIGALPPMRGVFRPEGMLSMLNGQSAAGAWTLKVVDHANADSGVLVSWSLGLCR